MEPLIDSTGNWPGELPAPEVVGLLCCVVGTVSLVSAGLLRILALRYSTLLSPSRRLATVGLLSVLLLGLCHPDEFNRLEPDSAPVRSLRPLVEARRALVQDRVRLTNRITAALNVYFPRVLDCNLLPRPHRPLPDRHSSTSCGHSR